MVSRRPTHPRRGVDAGADRPTSHRGRDLLDLVVHQARLQDLATAAEPRWDWTEPGPWTDEPELGLGGVLARFAARRATTLATIDALDDAGWARSGEHATFGILDVAGLLSNAVDHDEEHLRGLRS